MQNAGKHSEPDLIADATPQTFEAEAIDDSRRVLVLAVFWALWCGPCRMLMPRLEETVNTGKGAIKLVKVNVDEQPDLASQFGIREFLQSSQSLMERLLTALSAQYQRRPLNRSSRQ